MAELPGIIVRAVIDFASGDDASADAGADRKIGEILEAPSCPQPASPRAAALASFSRRVLQSNSSANRSTRGSPFQPGRFGTVSTTPVLLLRGPPHPIPIEERDSTGTPVSLRSRCSAFFISCTTGNGPLSAFVSKRARPLMFICSSATATMILVPPMSMPAIAKPRLPSSAVSLKQIGHLIHYSIFRKGRSI